MNEIAIKTMLYDFYGTMLTDRQREIYEEYYLNDMSFGEIAEQLQISRAAVFDNIKRSDKMLAHYEERLGLIGQYQSNKEVLEQILALTQDANKDVSIDRIRELVQDVLTHL